MKRSMNLWTLVLPLAASFAPLDPAAGQEPHFTFTVPVQAVSMLPEVSAVIVTCKVFTTATAPGLEYSTAMIGWTGINTPVSAGQDFVSDVTVTVNVEPDRNPWDVKSYHCVLLLAGPPGFYYGPFLAGSDPPEHVWTHDKPDSELTYLVKGTIP